MPESILSLYKKAHTREKTNRSQTFDKTGVVDIRIIPQNKGPSMDEQRNRRTIARPKEGTYSEINHDETPSPPVQRR
mgnify:CR=1 FL=1